VNARQRKGPLRHRSARHAHRLAPAASGNAWRNFSTPSSSTFVRGLLGSGSSNIGARWTRYRGHHICPGVRQPAQPRWQRLRQVGQCQGHCWHRQRLPWHGGYPGTPYGRARADRGPSYISSLSLPRPAPASDARPCRTRTLCRARTDCSTKTAKWARDGLQRLEIGVWLSGRVRRHLLLPHRRSLAHRRARAPTDLRGQPAPALVRPITTPPCSPCPGYTIGYFGRPFETKRLQELDAKDEGYLRFELGAGTVIPALELGVTSMAEGGIRQIVSRAPAGTPTASSYSRPADTLGSDRHAQNEAEALLVPAEKAPRQVLPGSPLLPPAHLAPGRPRPCR
jgi:hypothetical protein